MHLFGTGHSRIPVEEMFPRYGSYPGFNPIAELSMTFHTQVVGANGQRQAMFIERVPGLAEVILGNFRYGPRGRDDDLLGQRHLGGARGDGPRRPCARPAHDRGHVDGPDAVRRRPTRAWARRLCDEADLVIDLCTPPADALIRVDGLDTPVGPGSTLAYVAIVNSMKVRIAQLLTARGKMPPVITRASEVGDERSRALFDGAYAEHARRVARAIDIQGGGD